MAFSDRLDAFQLLPGFKLPQLELRDGLSQKPHQEFKRLVHGFFTKHDRYVPANSGCIPGQICNFRSKAAR
ncbi:hypothetical protein LIER_25728 [Lithospermum erythrorhizon]|uniref:Uncharacterized protein n=1 Tax=Lithospermum erythrorhizon TaxID=34254 RepID=A0AAV3RA48_LITER